MLAARTRAQEQHCGDRHEDDPDQVLEPRRQAAGRDQADEQDRHPADGHRRHEGPEPVAPMERDERGE